MDKCIYECDLHTHTNRSDGLESVKELIDRAYSLGIKVLAICDHDILPPSTVDEGGEDVIKYAKDRNIDFIKGIEFSCDTLVDDVHIVVLGCDWEEENIKDLIEEIDSYKRSSYKKFLDLLNEHGYDISLDEVLNYGGIKRKEILQKKLIFNVMADKGYTKTWAEAKIMANTDKRFKVKREKPEPASVIKMVHKAGGIAILAHPYLIKDKVVLNKKEVTRKEYIHYLIENGLDGIEGKYTYDKTSYNGSLTKEEIEKEVIRDYGDKVKIISGGSDFHGDYKSKEGKKREIGECGLTYTDFINNSILNKLI